LNLNPIGKPVNPHELLKGTERSHCERKSKGSQESKGKKEGRKDKRKEKGRNRSRRGPMKGGGTGAAKLQTPGCRDEESGGPIKRNCR